MAVLIKEVFQGNWKGSGGGGDGTEKRNPNMGMISGKVPQKMISG